MKRKKSGDLIKRLINNQISREELDTLLEELDDEETAMVYELYLKDHFDKIMVEHTLNKEKEKKKKV